MHLYTIRDKRIGQNNYHLDLLIAILDIETMVSVIRDGLTSSVKNWITELSYAWQAYHLVLLIETMNSAMRNWPTTWHYHWNTGLHGPL